MFVIKMYNQLIDDSCNLSSATKRRGDTRYENNIEDEMEFNHEKKKYAGRSTSIPQQQSQQNNLFI